MEWIKKGVIFKVDDNYDWMQTQSYPVAIDMLDDKIRLYFGTRDKNRRSRVGYIDVSADNPSNILYIHDKPTLEIGEMGTFDDMGVVPCCILNNGGLKYMYYAGFSGCNADTYNIGIGLAIYNHKEDKFIRYSKAPVFARSLEEPFFPTAPFVIIENNIWKMWYTSCDGWAEPNCPYYNIKYAESTNGINWEKLSIAIDYSHPQEVLGCPKVIKEDGIYKMFYAYRYRKDFRNNKNKSYRIGYAQSLDGLKWDRMDHKVGISLSEKGWDSEMIGYGYYAKYKEKSYLFYNGNDFGKSGLGYAELKND